MSDQNTAAVEMATKVDSGKEVLQLQNHFRDQNDGFVHPNIHLNHKDMASSSAFVPTEGSLSNAMDDESEQMHVDSLDVVVSDNQSRKDGLPVIERAGSSGKGLPYAPENWPSPGDVWTWRVGQRLTRNGFWYDRSVQPPDYLRSPTGKKMIFRSRVVLEQYVRKTFPDVDVDAFFASFSWKIPCSSAAKELADASLKIIKSNGYSKSTPTVRPDDCGANNEMCSMNAKTNSSLSPATCNVCCGEPNFCWHCCCILCSKTIDWRHEGCNFIKCEAPIGERFICGHVAHIECALRAYLAGTVGGSICLDAEYYCRWCENKTDLLLHAQKIIEVSESIDNKDDKRKVLNLGFSILRGSEKETAKKLRDHIATSIEKLKHGVSPDEKWKEKGGIMQVKQETITEMEPKQCQENAAPITKCVQLLDSSLGRFSDSSMNTMSLQDNELDTSEVDMNTHLITPTGRVSTELVHWAGKQMPSNRQTPYSIKKRKFGNKETRSLISHFISRGRGTWSRKRSCLPQSFRRPCSLNYYNRFDKAKPSTEASAITIEQFDQYYNKMREVFYQTNDKVKVIQAEKESLTTQVRSLTKNIAKLKEENIILVEEKLKLQNKLHENQYEVNGLTRLKNQYERDYRSMANKCTTLHRQYDDLCRTHNELSQTHNQLSQTYNELSKIFVKYVHKRDEEFNKLKDDFKNYKLEYEKRIIDANETILDMLIDFLENNPNTNYEWLKENKEKILLSGQTSSEKKRKTF